MYTTITYILLTSLCINPLNASNSHGRPWELGLEEPTTEPIRSNDNEELAPQQQTCTYHWSYPHRTSTEHARHETTPSSDLHQNSLMPPILSNNNMLFASQGQTYHSAISQVTSTVHTRRRPGPKPGKHQKSVLPAYTNPIVTTQTIFVEENQEDIQDAPVTMSQEMCQTPYRFPMIGSDDPSAIINSQAMIPGLPGVAENTDNLGRKTMMST